jgi:hypothetical protein
MKWLVLALGIFQGTWLMFDGTRAFVAGDYVTPKTGPRAGQLGPWSRIVSAVGLQPRSPVIKCLHVCLGLAWLVAAAAFILRPATGWWLVLCCGIATLWYLPIGTLLSLMVIILLLTPKLRAVS